MSVTLQLRRGIAADWALANPVLANGEPAYAVDTGDLRIGDGTSAWADLLSLSTTAAGAAISAADGNILTINPDGLFAAPQLSSDQW